MPSARRSAASGKTRASGNATAGALERALRFEKSGMRFFATAAARSADPFARQAFELLAGLEEQHYKDILAIARAIEEKGRFPAVSSTPSDKRMRMFGKELARIRKERLITGESADAMRKALAFEAEGREMYARMAERATHPQERRFFKLLSAEEQSHFDLIYDYLDFVEENRSLRMQDG
jgi:rubrerythrin